jgi:hypothetical protein
MGMILTPLGQMAECAEQQRGERLVVHLQVSAFGGVDEVWELLLDFLGDKARCTSPRRPAKRSRM